MTRAVFFDFDGTLLPQKNSLAWFFVRALPGSPLRNQRTAAFVRTMGELIPRATLGLVERDAMYVELIRAVFEGLPVAAARIASEKVATHVEAALFPQMRAVLAQHADDRCFVVTANMEPLLEAFCEGRGLTCIGTRLERDGATYSGRLASALCKDQAKVERIREHIGPSTHTVAYGNSLEDLPMLRAVKQPVLVNPGRRLSRAPELCFAERIFTERETSAFGA